MRERIIIMLTSLLFVSFITLISSSNVKYKCGQKLKINSCQYEDNLNGIIYVKPCSSGEKCVLAKSITEKDIYQCVKYDDFSKLDVGESCTTSNECKSSICNEGKCIYLDDYIYTCTSNEQCGLNSFCIDNVCKGMETCRSDEDCPYSSICGAFNGKKSCLKLYSYSDGDNVDRGDLCKSGFLGYNQEKKEYQCASATISNDTCDEVHQCEYEYTIDKYKGKTKVDCVTDNEGGYHCPPTTDSKQYQKYYTYSRKKQNMMMSGIF